MPTKDQLVRNCHAAVRGTAARAGAWLEAGRASWRSGNPLRAFGVGANVSTDESGNRPRETSFFQRLQDSSELLAGVSAGIEACFLALGGSLVKLPDISDELVSHSENLIRLATGRETGASTIASTMKLLEGPLSFIDRCQEQLEDLNLRMEQAVAQIDRLVASEVHLNRAVAPLTYIRINFKIESAALPNSVQQMFLALTEDVERLHQQVSLTFGAKFATLRDARVTIGRVAKQLKADAQRQGRILREKRGAVERSLAELEKDLKKNEGRDVQLSKVSHAINRQVGSLVVLMQTQDIVSQKLAHAGKAITAIHERCQSQAGGAADGNTHEDLAYCEASCRLQAAQLDAIGAEIKQAGAGIQSAMRELDHQIIELDREPLKLSEFDRLTAGVDGLVQVLLDTIDQVRAMTRSAVETAEQAYLALRPIGGLASNLTGVMRELSAQIHLIALNAQVQAAHNSIGNGLEVLASSTANVSVAAGGISEQVAAGVDSLTIQLDRLVDFLVVLRDEGTEKLELMENDARAKEAELHSLRDETLKELRSVSDCVTQIRLLTADMGKQNNLDAVVGERFDDLRKILSSVAEKTKEHLSRTNHSYNPQRFSEELSKPYTVASEREVHRKLFGFGPAPSKAPLATTEISLFDDEPGTSAAQEAESEETISVSSSSETAPEQTSLEPSVARKDESLGDNVDLF